MATIRNIGLPKTNPGLFRSVNLEQKQDQTNIRTKQIAIGVLSVAVLATAAYLGRNQISELAGQIGAIFSTVPTDPVVREAAQTATATEAAAAAAAAELGVATNKVIVLETAVAGLKNITATREGELSTAVEFLKNITDVSGKANVTAAAARQNATATALAFEAEKAAAGNVTAAVNITV
jgi:hypothetical protein